MPVVPTPLVLRSPGKINLFLHVTGKRDDGYHSLETVFQFLNFADTLTFEPSGSDEIKRIDNHNFSLPENDLIIQTAQLLKNKFPDQKFPGITITLEKIIPPGSGMGGGSSNAATTLTALNKIWGINLNKKELLNFALKLGADVPVFIRGKSCWARGIGNEFENFEPATGWLCFCIPSSLVSTAKVFNHPDLIRSHPPISKTDFENGNFTNDLEPVTRKLYPDVNEVFSILGEFGKVKMNGSGSSIYINCESKSHAEKVCGLLPADIKGFVAQSINVCER